MRPKVLKQEPDEALIEKIINKQLPPMLDYLESQVPRGGFLFGDNITLADVSLLSPFVNAGYAGFAVDPSRWPVLSAFMEQVRSQPVVARLLAESAAAMGQAKSPPDRDRPGRTGAFAPRDMHE